MNLTYSNERMKQTLKRINELQNEIIEKSKKIPGSEEYVQQRVTEFVSHSRCKRCHKVLNISELKTNPDGVGRVCIDEEACRKRIEKHSKQ